MVAQGNPRAPLRTHVANLTTCGHNVTMKQVRIAELKARLSEHLRAVRGGDSVTVLDRDTPVAQIVPIRMARALRIRSPAAGAPRPGAIRLPRAAKLDLDLVDLLLEERQGHR